VVSLPVVSVEKQGFGSQGFSSMQPVEPSPGASPDGLLLA
jgi:hypothetical protein